jgi:hypothetical protein
MYGEMLLGRLNTNRPSSEYALWCSVRPPSPSKSPYRPLNSRLKFSAA